MLRTWGRMVLTACVKLCIRGEMGSGPLEGSLHDRGVCGRAVRVGVPVMQKLES